MRFRVGRLHVDGEVLTSDKAGGMWERRKMAWNGHLAVSVVIAKGKVEDGPIVVARGFSEPDGRPADEVHGADRRGGGSGDRRHEAGRLRR